MLGYTPTELKKRIEFNFVFGMSWENHGVWHIDHIKPVSVFKEDTPTRVVNMLCNLRPIWASENLSKGNKWKY